MKQKSVTKIRPKFSCEIPWKFTNKLLSGRRSYQLASIEFTCPENSNWCLLLPDSNLCLKFQNNFTAKFWATFNYGLLLQRFFWNYSGILDKKIWHDGFQDHDKVCKYDNYNNTFSHTPKFTTSRIKINEKSWTERFDVAMTPLSSDKIQRKKNEIWLNIIRFEVAN